MTNTLAKPTAKLVERNSVVVEERTLTFESVDDGAALREVETGATWDVFTLEATEGPLSGAVLQLVPITYSFWFGWSDYHPNTPTYNELSGK